MLIAQENLFFETENAKFELIFNYKDAFEKEIFLEKYIDLFDNKDFIIGDVSHDKLRLQGFVLSKDSNNPKNINNLEDYLLEHCNLGCPFYVLKKTQKSKTHQKF